MRGKIAFVLGAAVGYVLGTRAGRERYEQIKRGAERLWNTAPVQQGVHVVKEAVDERAEDLKSFAIRVGNDVFSNLASTRGKSDPFSTTDEAAAAEDSTKSDASAKQSTGSSSSKSTKKASGKSAGKSGGKSTGKSTGTGKSAGGKASS